MKSLKASVLTNFGFDMPWMPLFVLLLFFGLFVAVVFWITKKERKPYYEMVEQIPLNDLEAVEEGESHE